MSRKWIFVGLIFALLMTACGQVTPLPPTPVAATVISEVSPTGTATPAPAGITLTDGLGREVTLAAPAQKIVSLAPSNTEVLFAVGAGAQVAGCDDFSDYPAEAGSLPKIGGSMGNYNLEAITALQPDLVLAAQINTPEQVKALEDLGLTVYYLANPNTLEEMYANLEIVARLTGHETETAALIDSLQARAAAVDEKVATLTEKPLVFYELDSTDAAKPYTAGPGTFVDLLIQRAGGQNLGAQLDGAWVQISIEQLVVLDPQFILLGDSMWGVTVESVGQRSGWETLTAVQEGRVFTFDDNLVSRPGPRLVDGLEALAKLLHPELFQ
jgi:iron complex transport system substrate-binding protein